MTRGAAGAEVTAHSVAWQFDAGPDGTAEIAVPYALIGSEADQLLLTGLGEKGEDNLMAIAGHLAERGITGLAVAGTAYPEVSRLTPEQFEQSVVGSAEALANDITGGERPLRHAIGNSAGGSHLIVAAYHRPELFERVSAVAPSPLDTTALGADFKQQARELLDRFETSGLKDVIAENSPAGWLDLMREIRGGLTYAATLDNVAILNALRGRLQIYVGDLDQVAPAREYAALAGDMLTLVPGMDHPTLLNAAGRDRLAGIISGDESGMVPLPPTIAEAASAA